jgi:hypothetical protein
VQTPTQHSWRVDLGDGYWFNNTPDYYNLFKEGVEKIEKLRNCRFVCEWNVVQDGKIHHDPMLIFWNDTAHPQGSNWMALFYYNDWFVRDGITASQLPIECVVSNDKQVLFSKSRHDFRSSNDGSVIVDGGRDYTRVLGNVRCERVWLVPQQGELKIIPKTMALLMLERNK